MNAGGGMRRIIALAAVLLTQVACLEYGGLSVRLDLGVQNGTMTWHDLRSSADGDTPEATVEQDLQQVVDIWAGGESLALPPPEMGFRGWKVGARRLVEHEGHLDGVIDFSWLTVWSDSHSAQLPVRYCPPPDVRVVAANADARERNGCLLWGGGAPKVRVEAVPIAAPQGRSLLVAWRAKGSPGEPQPPVSP